MQRASRSHSRWGQVGVAPPPSSVALEPPFLPPAAPPVPLDPSARVTWLTRRLNETHLHLHILINLEIKRGSGRRTDKAVGLVISGSSVSSCLFCFSKQLKNKLTGKKKKGCDGTNYGVCFFFYSFCLLALHPSRMEVRVATWRYSDITKGNNGAHSFLCHYQIDCVTNLSTTVGHYANNSYMCTLELLIYMSSHLHRHTLNRPHFRILTTVCVCA